MHLNTLYCIYFLILKLTSALLKLSFTIFSFNRKKPTHVNVNCWFCNQDTVVPYGNRNCWDCPYCEQYNGFQEVRISCSMTKIIHHHSKTGLIYNIRAIDAQSLRSCSPRVLICRTEITTNPSLLNTWSISTTEFRLVSRRHPRLFSGSTARCCCARNATLTRH